VFITELLTAFIRKNTTQYRKNADSKIINIANCKTWKNQLLAVEYTILIRHNYETAKTRALYESMDRPTGRPADNLPNSDALEDLHRNVPDLTVWMN